MIGKYKKIRISHQKGLTLVEVAIVLVILGLLIGLGVSLIGPLTKRAKIQETREIVKQAKEAVLGFAVKNGYLPNSLGEAGARAYDSWGREIRYFSFQTGSGDICATNQTPMEVRECLDNDCSSNYLIKSNIAFVVYSFGEDGDGSCTGNSSPFYHRLAGMPYELQNQQCSYSTSNPRYNYDDILAYVSLDEIRSLRGCPQPLKITSPENLPQAEEDTFYHYSLTAIGGSPPYSWSGTVGSGLGINSSGIVNGTVNVNLGTNTGELPDCSASVNYTVTVTDSAGASISQNGTIPVRPQPLKIINELLPRAIEGLPYNAEIYASGGRVSRTFNMTVEPNCPNGLTCTGNKIIGTPNSGTAGNYLVTVTVNDNCSSTSKKFDLVIDSSSGGGGGG